MCEVENLTCHFCYPCVSEWRRKPECKGMTSAGFSSLSHVSADCPQPALRDDDSSISNVCVWTVAEWCLSLVGLMWVVIDRWLTRHPQQIMKSYAVLVFAVFLWRLWLLLFFLYETENPGNIRRCAEEMGNSLLCSFFFWGTVASFSWLAEKVVWTWRNSMPHVTLWAD